MRKIIHVMLAYAPTLSFLAFTSVSLVTYGGFGLDSQSQAYADEALDALTTQWDGPERVIKAVSQFRMSVAIEQFETNVKWPTCISAQLGACSWITNQT